MVKFKLREFLKKFLKRFESKSIGIDLGTATVLVYVEDKGIVLHEPSVVAIDTDADKIIKVGREAQAMMGRTTIRCPASTRCTASTTARTCSRPTASRRRTSRPGPT